MEKYYTPTIDEFRVGFEFEMKVYGEEDQWGPCIYNVPTWVNDSIRVPYLTKEQIEAEGWTYSNLAQRFFHTETGLDDDELACGHGIWLTQMGLNLTIIDCKLRLHRVRFDGNIKNISEFRVLLRQLGIKHKRNE